MIFTTKDAKDTKRPDARHRLRALSSTLVFFVVSPFRGAAGYTSASSTSIGLIRPKKIAGGPSPW